MKKKNKKVKKIVNNSDKFAIIEKLEFDRVDFVFDALHEAFLADSMDEEVEEYDPRFFALWNCFLSMTGWTEEQYWAAWKQRTQNHSCPNCVDEKKSDVVSDAISDAIEANKTDHSKSN
jgi:hypothetical protein